MKTLKKTIGFGMVASILLPAVLLTAVLLLAGVIGGCQNLPEQTEKESSEESPGESTAPSTYETAAERYFGSVFVKIDIGNGYDILLDVGTGQVPISRSVSESGFFTLEIRSTGRSYAKLMEEEQEIKGSLPEMLEGPNGWKYYWNDNWDSNPETAPVANISRTFLKEKDGIVVTIDQYDYAGGMYNGEVEDVVLRIELLGKTKWRKE